ncbi:MAG: SBBP repeat-containing protein [Candidatus Cloacimonas sp.]|jgi:hypothetical protein|nr:SBBP repeat-containing protein [Candidatus Cloacimonas sp.]
MISFKGFMLSLVAVVFATCLVAQTQDWLYAQKAGGTSDDQGKAIATDSTGNSYVTGYFSGTASFGSISLNSSGGSDIFVAKQDSNGNWLWAKNAGGSYYDNGYGIAVDDAGNVYLTGNFKGTSSFGSTSLTCSLIYSNIFVAKLDSNGNWLWAKQAGGPNDDYGNGIAVDSSGNVYLDRKSVVTSSFGSTSLTVIGSSDVFVAKLDGNGNWLWAKNAGGSYSDRGNGIAVDSSGNVYLTGYFYESASFGSTSLSGSGYYDIIVAKLDSNGNWLWAKKAGGLYDDRGSGIAVDGAGNVYMTGYFSGTASFGSTSLAGSGSYSDIFVAKLDSNGNWLWAKQAGGSSDEYGYGIAVHSSGDVYLTGYFSGNASFGSTSLTSSGGYDIFVAKLDSNGNWLWAKQAGGSNDDYGNGIAVDSSGNVYLTGYFYESASFGSTSLTGSGYYDIFVAKLSAPQLILLSPKGGDIWQGGSVKQIYWTPTEDINTINILISYNNGSSWIYLNSAPVDASLWGYTFTVPAISSAQCLIKIISADIPDVFYDVSDNPFTVTMANPPTVSLISPDSSGIRIQSDRPCSINWSAFQVSNINLDVSYNYGISWNSIATNIPSSLGTYQWLVSDSLFTSCVFRVSDSQNAANYDFSNNLFTICKLELLTPNGTEVWVNGLSKAITWTQRYIGNVKLEYSANGGSTWQLISASVSAASGSYNWLIPTIYSTTCLVRISEVANPELVDVSDNVFTIRPYLMISSPNGGECLPVYTLKRIFWTATMEVSNIVIDYSINGGTSWLPIQSSPYNAALGYYDWIVPNTITSQALIKICSSSNSSIFDVSDAVFNIITELLAPGASFSADVTGGIDPLTVQFSDLSTPGTGEITNWAWDFGDGCSSTEQNPQHIYSNPGLYSVSLIVTNAYALQDTITQADYITVAPSVPELLLHSNTSLNFGSVYIAEQSDYEAVYFSNTGGANLVVSEIHFMGEPLHFEYLLPHGYFVLAPGQDTAILVRFAPLTVGALSDTLYIVNNSVNEPILKISLRGTGQYVPPKPPENVELTMLGTDALLAWDAVTQNEQYQPISPDYYIVFYNGPGDIDGLYYYLSSETDLSYTHVGVGMFAEHMFYRVRAYKYYGRGQVDIESLGLSPQMTEAQVSEVLHKGDER